MEIREISREGREDPFRHFHEANAFAWQFFRDVLWDEARGREARAYLERRGIGRETAERFGLGYGPDEWRALRDAAAKHKQVDKPLEQELKKAFKWGFYCRMKEQAGTVPDTNSATFQMSSVAQGWLVYEPDSEHYPTVSGGRAIVLYLLPGGEIDFTRAAP